MANRFRWTGLDELREELRNLPQDLTAEASDIVNQSAEGAAEFIRAAYPERTGNLKRGVVVVHQEAGKWGAAKIVKNTAKHAYIFENGSQARHNAIGANRGAMPPGNVFVPRIVRARQQMYRTLAAMLETHGLKVSGTA
jgi:hypothetical protein